MNPIARGMYVTLLILTVVSASAACPACYGAKDSPMTAGMNTAILVMLGITGVVLSLFLGAAVYFWRRGRRHRMMLSDKLFVNREGQLFVTNVKGIPEWNNS
ncbi:MAG TPA: hypothetical protein VMW43_09065 [Bacteroidota bacterium]|nr:hypothetical protein [Bacteroidota bacterium]